jgi:flavin-binding protein dodecin
VQCHVSEPPRDLEGIFSGHARTGASGVSPNTCSCPSWLYVKDMSAEVDNGKIVNYRISAQRTFKLE